MAAHGLSGSRTIATLDGSEDLMMALKGFLFSFLGLEVLLPRLAREDQKGQEEDAPKPCSSPSGPDDDENRNPLWIGVLAFCHLFFLFSEISSSSFISSRGPFSEASWATSGSMILRREKISIRSSFSWKRDAARGWTRASSLEAIT